MTDPLEKSNFYDGVDGDGKNKNFKNNFKLKFNIFVKKK